MANKKISEFPVTTSLAGGDIFLIDHLGSTSTVAFSALSAAVTNDSVKLPSAATGGQVLTYNGSTTTWVASAVPKELPSTALSGQVLTYNGSTSTWVAGSLSAQGFTASLSSNGYTHLPNGIIMQWGYYNGSGNAALGINITFPIPFPTACTMMNANYQIGANSTGTAVTVGIPTTTTGTVYYNGSGYAFYWFAIGY